MKKEIFEWIYCIIIALILALIFRYFIGTPTIVKQKSMYPTLIPNERLILNRTIRITKKMPQRGEIITFEAPSIKEYDSSNIDLSNPIANYEIQPKSMIHKFIYNILEIGKYSYIKRVIGLPGEHIEIRADGNVYINGEVLEEEYLNENVKTKLITDVGFDDFVVPEKCLFVMGDNRNESIDSRAFGCVPIEKVEGVVVGRFFPFSRFGKVY